VPFLASGEPDPDRLPDKLNSGGQLHWLNGFSWPLLLATCGLGDDFFPYVYWFGCWGCAIRRTEVGIAHAWYVNAWLIQQLSTIGLLKSSGASQ